MGIADKKYINLEEGLHRVGNNEVLYKKLLGKFSVDIQGLDASISNGDYNVAEQIVHAAKGVSANLSLIAFYDSSVILMEQLRNGGIPDQFCVTTFEMVYAETVAAIQTYLN